MSRERKIVGIRPPAPAMDPLPQPDKDASEVMDGSAPDSLPPPEPQEQADFSAVAEVDPWWAEAETVRPGRDRVGIAAACIALLGLVWAVAALHQASGAFTTVPTAQNWSAWLTGLAAPLVVIAIAWLAYVRLSAREARDQLSSLAAARAEQEALGQQLTALLAQVDAAERSLRDRADAFSSHGLDASARLTDAGAALSRHMLLCENAARTLQENADVAQAQLESLSIGLPKMDEVAARLAESIRQSGQSAYQFGGQLEASIASLTQEGNAAQQALAEAGARVTHQLASLQTASGEAIAAVEEVAEKTAVVTRSQREQAMALLSEFAASSGEMTERSTAEISDARMRLHTLIEQDQAMLRADVAALGAAGDALRASIAATTQQASELQSALSQTRTAAEEDLAAIGDSFARRSEQLRSAFDLMNGSVGNLSTRIAEGDAHAVELVQRAETLLIALDSVAREIDETIPGALARVDAQIAQTSDRFAAVAPLAETGSESAAQLEQRARLVGEQMAENERALAQLGEALEARLSAHAASVAEIEAALARIDGSAASLADVTTPRLAEQVRAAAETGDNVVQQARRQLDQLLDDTALSARDRLTASLSSVTGEALTQQLDGIIARSSEAVAAATAASDRLMRQLITIADASASLETRAKQVDDVAARARGESLAQQLSLMTEALHSTSVDITRVLDAEIAEQAWHDYLRGERGIFSRRAARLLTTSESRDVLRRYEEDEGFRGLVHRYIADFEAMLRQLMDSRAGEDVSVTLLSSDIGKIYVALAQSIERLRS